MRALAFDPGHLTGVAAFDASGRWVMGLTVSNEALQESLLSSLVKQFKPEVIIVESLPTYQSDNVTVSNTEFITRWFRVAGYKVVPVKPGQWKNMVLREKIPGTHQVDAATMGKWYIQRGSKDGRGGEAGG